MAAGNFAAGVSILFVHTRLQMFILDTNGKTILGLTVASLPFGG